MNSYHPKDPKRAMASHVATLREDVKKVIMTQHVLALRAYAKKEMIEDETLTPEEFKDREIRVREYLAIGRSYLLTDRMLVAHIFDGLKDIQYDCECPTCREN